MAVSRLAADERAEPKATGACRFTPGRLLDPCSGGNIRLGTVHTMMVLDEADEMLKMGFVQDVEKIIESADPKLSACHVRATTNQDVLTVSWKYQHDPIEIVVQAEAENKPNITQYIIESDQKQKYEHLLYLLTRFGSI